ncbi:MAG: ornithine cyclodeaminase family protein [Halodesulfurarchaeum sp.]
MLKVVCMHHANTDRGLPVVNDQISLVDAWTGLPVSYMNGLPVTTARTSCLGGLAARGLTSGPITVCIIGAGRQGRWQARGIAAATDLESVIVHDRNAETRAEAVGELRNELDADVDEAADVTDAVESADLIVTATTSADPVFPGEALSPGAVVVAIGAYTSSMQEIDATTFDRAGRVFADVPEKVAGIGDLLGADFLRADLVPFSSLVRGDAGRESDDEILVVESVGSSVIDAATASHLYDRAVSAGVGTEVSL